MGADKVELAELDAEPREGRRRHLGQRGAGEPALRFLAPTVDPMRWVGEQALPFAERPGRNVVLGLSQTDWIDIAALERLYPKCELPRPSRTLRLSAALWFECPH